MKPLHTQLLPKKSTSSPSKISGSPPLISSWSRSSLMLRSEYLRWFLHEEWEIPNQNQLHAWVYSRRVTRLAVIFWATAPCQNRFSVSGRRIILNFALQNRCCLPLCLSDWDGYNNNRSVLCQLPKLFHSGKLVLKMILKDDRRSWFGFQVGCQPQKINFHHHKS